MEEWAAPGQCQGGKAGVEYVEPDRDTGVESVRSRGGKAEGASGTGMFIRAALLEKDGYSVCLMRRFMYGERGGRAGKAAVIDGVQEALRQPGLGKG